MRRRLARALVALHNLWRLWRASRQGWPLVLAFMFGCGGQVPTVRGLGDDAASAAAYAAAREVWEWAADETAGACRERARIAQDSLVRGAPTIECPAPLTTDQCLVAAFLSLTGDCDESVAAVNALGADLDSWRDALARGDDTAEDAAGRLIPGLLAVARDIQADSAPPRESVAIALRVLSAFEDVSVTNGHAPEHDGK